MTFCLERAAHLADRMFTRSLCIISICNFSLFHVRVLIAASWF